MIRINLLDEKIDKSGIYFLQVLAFGSILFLSLAGCFLVHDGLASKKGLLEKEKTLLESKLTRLKKVTKEVEGLESKKKLLKDKLMTIASLKAEKSGPVRVLDDLNLAVPDRSWLRATKESKGQIQVSGVALDNQTVSDFMDNLDASKFFSDIDLLFSNQVVEDGVKLQSFSITAKKLSALELQRMEKEKEKEKEKEEAEGTKK